jgi:hypothetical protein
MKYPHKLDHKFPVEVRLYCYQYFLDHPELHNEFGLCMGLPLIAWGKIPVLNNADFVFYYAENIWSYSNSSIAFPEVTEDVIKSLNALKTPLKVKKLRISYLKQFIKQLIKL